MSGWFFLLSAAALNAGANLALKRYALDQQLPWFIAGVGLFGMNLLLYTRAIRSLELSIAYPILVAVTVALVAVGSSYLFLEKISLHVMAGIALILLGVALVMVPVASG